MLQVRFWQIGDVEDSLYRYAVIVSRHRGKWIYCKHKSRDTWEIPGGRREEGEAILHTARRELMEETGALRFEMVPVCAYSVGKAEAGYGLLCYAEVWGLGPLPGFEIERIHLFEDEPARLTYPHIQPLLLDRIQKHLSPG